MFQEDGALVPPLPPPPPRTSLPSSHTPVEAAASYYIDRFNVSRSLGVTSDYTMSLPPERVATSQQPPPTESILPAKPVWSENQSAEAINRERRSRPRAAPISTRRDAVRQNGQPSRPPPPPPPIPREEQVCLPARRTEEDTRPARVSTYNNRLVARGCSLIIHRGLMRCAKCTARVCAITGIGASRRISKMSRLWPRHFWIPPV